MRNENIQKKRNQKKRIRRARRLFQRVLFNVFLIAFFAISSCAIYTKATTAKEAEDIYYKYYTQIEIGQGDSLWKIAGKYMENGPYESRKDYMDEVVEINQLSSTTIIKGQHLIVPYYENTYK